MRNNLDALHKFLSRDHYIHRILKLCGILFYRRRFSTASIFLLRMLISQSLFVIFRISFCWVWEFLFLFSWCWRENAVLFIIVLTFIKCNFIIFCGRVLMVYSGVLFLYTNETYIDIGIIMLLFHVLKFLIEVYCFVFNYLPVTFFLHYEFLV